MPIAKTRPPSTVGVPRGPGNSSLQVGPTRVFQSGAPPSALNASRCWAPSRSPIVKMRPSTIATLEKPAPIPDAFQSSGGPPSGQD